MPKLAAIFFLAFLCATAAHAQNLVVEREIPRGYRVVDVYLPADRNTLLDFQNPERSDLNGDGSPEIVMVHDDAQGTPQELVVVDVAPSSPEVLWTVDLNAVGGALDTKFHGFFDIWSGAENRAAVFGEDGVQVFHPDSGSDVVFSLDANHRLLGVVDFDGDGLHELIVENPVEDVIQVWGAGAAGRPRR